jgi:hypothetical protein
VRHEWCTSKREGHTERNLSLRGAEVRTHLCFVSHFLMMLLMTRTDSPSAPGTANGSTPCACARCRRSCGTKKNKKNAIFSKKNRINGPGSWFAGSTPCACARCRRSCVGVRGWGLGFRRASQVGQEGGRKVAGGGRKVVRRWQEGGRKVARYAGSTP